MKIFRNIKGIFYMLSFTKIFRSKSILKDKRIAIIGAANSAFEEENGNYIDAFDYVIRLNKAPYSLTENKSKFIGTKMDILLHSFYENNDSGGGVIDFNLYKKLGLKYLINPHNNFNGLKTHLNYFKRNFYTESTYLLSKKEYKNLIRGFGKKIPTVGYIGLYIALNSGAKEVFITGFTFFRTPYAQDYRDHLIDMKANQKHIDKQGLHDPELELKKFIQQVKKVKADRNIIMDKALQNILKKEL